jgi:hypothetical protein
VLAGGACGLGVVAIKLADVVWRHTFSLGLLGAFFILVGVQSVMMGLLAELQVRTYHESQKKPIYLVRRTVGLDGDGTTDAPERVPGEPARLKRV